MRALRYHGTKDIRVEHDVAEPRCKPLQVKIRPAFVGICGSDLHEYLHQHFIPTKDNPHPITGEGAPLTLGHEFSGVVVEVGTDVKGFAVDDHVVVQPTLCCGTCETCLEGHINCCETFGFLGLHGGGGGLSDFICVPYDFVFKIPTSIPLDVGALVEPLAVSWHAVETTGIIPGDDVLVLGAGPIGVGVVQCLKAKGARNIIVSEPSSERRRSATFFGATHVVNPITENVVQKCVEICQGSKPKIALDCAGVPTSIRTACVAVKPRGKIVNVAIWSEDVAFQPSELMIGEKTYTCVLGYLRSDFEGVIKALTDGALKPESMITKKIAIDRVVEEGFTALIEENDKHVKILIDLSK